jgi:oligopeptide transport system permease protein
MKIWTKKKMKKMVYNLSVAAQLGYGQVAQDELFKPAPFKASRAEETAYTGYSYWKSTFRIFFRNKMALFFLSFVLLILAFTFIQPYLPGQRDPLITYNDLYGNMIRNAAPGKDFWFGTNSIGQDLWSRTWAGTRTSILIGLTVAVIQVCIGITIGLLWGYVRSLEEIFTEMYNIFDNIPQTLMLILISYVLRPSVNTLIVALSITGWLITARFIRNQVMIIRDRDYNLASRCLGTTTFRVITRNLIPYLVSIITMRMAMSIPVAISEEVFITYIGLGLPINIPSLGNLIVSGIDKMLEPTLRYQLIFPAVVLCALTISFYVIGNAFADASDPKNHTV